MNWRKFLVLISSCFVIAAGIVIACADSTDPYDEYPSFFFNNINKDPAYQPFYFTTLLPYYTEGWYDRDPKDEVIPDQNVEAWYNYTGRKASRADIDSFVYKYPLSGLLAMSTGASIGIPKEVMENSFTKWLLANKDKDASTYLLYAKKCEPETQALNDHYDATTGKWVTPHHDMNINAGLRKQGLDAIKGVQNNFLRTRYIYQVLRLAFYGGDNTTTLRLYKDLLSNGTDTSVIALRCKGLLAGALFKTGKTTEAAYIYSKLFDQSDEMKLNAYVSFNWATKGNIDTVLQMCKTDHERSVLYLMKGLYEYSGDETQGLQIMENAYHYDPSIRGLDIVMTREINKAEQRYLAAGFDTHLYSAYEITTDDEATLKERKKLRVAYVEYLKRLNEFALKVAAGKTNANNAYWHLSSAYLYFIQGDEPNCKKYLDIAQHEKMTDMERDVHDVIATLYTVRLTNTITATTETELLPYLKWIEQRTQTNDRFNKVYRDLMTSVLSSAYLKQGDTIKAIYCLSRGVDTGGKPDNYEDGFGSTAGTLLEHMDATKLEAVQAFVNKKDKTPYEKWLVNNTQYNVATLQELEGTKYIRLHQFGKAAEILANVPGNVLNKRMLPDVLVSHLNDVQEWSTSDSDNQYNKLTFARKMDELEKKMAKDPKDSRAAYQYANALYNITYYGKAWAAVKYYRGGTENEAYRISKERKELSSIDQEYYNAHLPEKYYLQAFNNSTDPEVKARCLFLAAKCWQKNCPEPKHTDKYYYWDHENYYSNSLKNPYYKQIKDGYSKTKFYNTAKNTCSYLGDYLRKG